jgi:hypothetical protein
MPKRSNAFQRLVLLIQQTLATGWDVHESEMLADRETGELREVDIVLRSSAGPHPVVIGVECMAKKRPADVTWVEQQWAKHRVLTDKLILVSECGFSRPALEKAKKLGIDAFALNAIFREGEAAIRAVTQIGFDSIHLKVIRSTVGMGAPGPILTDIPIYDAAGRSQGTISEIWKRFAASPICYNLLKSRRENGRHQRNFEHVLPEGAYTLNPLREVVPLNYIVVTVEIWYEDTDLQATQGSYAGHAIAHAITSDGTLPPMQLLVITEPDGKMIFTMAPLNSGTVSPGRIILARPVETEWRDVG